MLHTDPVSQTPTYIADAWAVYLPDGTCGMVFTQHSSALTYLGAKVGGFVLPITHKGAFSTGNYHLEPVQVVTSGPLPTPEQLRDAARYAFLRQWLGVVSRTDDMWIVHHLPGTEGRARCFGEHFDDFDAAVDYAMVQYANLTPDR